MPWHAIMIRGVGMGAADIVPGVSGGTIAFITGIYTRLLGAIRSFDLQALRLLFRGDWSGIWTRVDGGFLLSLVSGIALSVFGLARLMVWLLDNHPEPLWALFFGLILGSGLVLRQRVPVWGATEYAAIAAGCGAALAFAYLPPIQMGDGLPAFFFAGMIAICAMILPGISGSFLLVLLGMYAQVLQAVQDFNLLPLAALAIGAILGLMGFSRVLYWLLKRWAGPTTSALTGFIFGSLLIVWPWKQTTSVYLDRHGMEQPLQRAVVGPTEYLLSTGQDPHTVICVLLMVTGFMLVFSINLRAKGG